MVTERVNSTTQPRFAAVLRYFVHGDFSTFCRAADLAFGSTSSTERYFCANLLFACQISGLCEVSNATGATQWWVSHRDDVRILSLSPKEIGTSSDWFSANLSCTVPLVTDSTMLPLVLGSRLPDQHAGPGDSVFNRALADLLPAFKDIERQLCVEVPYSEDIEGHAEVFSRDSGLWEPTTLDTLTGSELIRIRKDYSGLAYYVQHSNLGLRFKITQPEWAFVAAYHLLPWRLVDILKVDNTTVRTHRTVRLPILMYRTLFAAADAVRIGPTVTFENVETPCIDGVRRYFEGAGERK
jgi:hypothetical protein